ncbi:L-ribulose-5-phosphate 3-epimerase [Sediminispirochaeta smaragdinae]|uniref:L-ribulose-5-phosphate 3-epimerase n=1 Tax=Sediminispirochaeta smaragdinae (strain DSM 11293 / JCM 15392 / SEBR 4228) TaxID=573413 RepID=E1RAG9_SEDSS|nr:L-ribulose-5-phosphate 3-epimerase [Sediminispirochaeta smaragdinae]ADK79460.1 hexulose-6-phosphate isomerase [Sediminispirochaeta smaragdinae DSM 11293]
MTLQDVKFGIYEKALPETASWPEKLDLAKRLDFSFVEMSIDESDRRLARLEWTRDERKAFMNCVFDSGISVPSICLSGHRRFPLGSHNPDIRARARKILHDAINFSAEVGIRTIQLAGYDVYYEAGDDDTWRWFIDGLNEGVQTAAKEHVMLSMEIMDTHRMSSIVRFMNLKRMIMNPWFTVYPDLGNLTAWGNDVVQELELGKNLITAIHLKDTLAVTKTFPGQFRDVPFGDGCVDFVAAFRALKRLHFTGPFLMEMWSGKGNDPVKEIEEARKWIIARMKEGAYINE